ncbi:MAG: hypothetical protein H0U10_16350 [Chloroflexia bacterium]|nr:hypothetical protein [Chloroflexia bacterium]
MAKESTLDITGHRGLPVPHRGLRPRGAIDHLVVLLPGYVYTCDMPLLYYAENRALEVGADILRVEYAYNRTPEFRAIDDAEQRRWLLADASAAIDAALAQRPYRGVTLIGKSLGTAAMAHLVADLSAAPVSCSWSAVWLTPLLAEPPVLAGIRAFAGPSLVVIGTADPHHDAALLADLGATPGIETVVVAGADHGMDIPGDPIASVQALGRYVDALVRFLPAPD